MSSMLWTFTSIRTKNYTDCVSVTQLISVIVVVQRVHSLKVVDHTEASWKSTPAVWMPTSVFSCPQDSRLYVVELIQYSISDMLILQRNEKYISCIINYFMVRSRILTRFIILLMRPFYLQHFAVYTSENEDVIVVQREGRNATPKFVRIFVFILKIIHF